MSPRRKPAAEVLPVAEPPEEGAAVTEPERLLTPEEVADRLGIGKVTARAWLRSGKLPVTRLGEKGLLRCREADLDEYIRDLAERQRRAP